MTGHCVFILTQIMTCFLTASDVGMEHPAGLKHLLWFGFLRLDPTLKHRPEVRDLVVLCLICLNFGLGVGIYFLRRKEGAGQKESEGEVCVGGSEFSEPSEGESFTRNSTRYVVSVGWYWI